MAGIHIRDLYVGNSGWAGYLFWSRSLVVIREMFLAGRWTDGTFTNKTEYDNNIVLALSDCAVSSSSAARITSTTGGFSALNTNYLITLLAANDENRGVYRIFKILNDNEIEVRNPPPDGWTTETGISGRLFESGNGDPIANNNTFSMIPPSGTNEPRFYTQNGYNLYLQCYPDGMSGGHNVGTDTTTFQVSYTATDGYLNAYFSGDGPEAVFYASTPSYNLAYVVYGELEGAASGDTYPGYMFEDVWVAITVAADTYNDINVYMIDHTPAALAFKFAGLSRASNEYQSADFRQMDLNCRSVGHKAKLEKPWVYNGDANGGYPRGKVGTIRLTNKYWEVLRPVGSAGLWRHVGNGICFPMNGPNDPPMHIY